MKYIIFGAGQSGRKAREFLSWERTLCFADNKLAGEVLDGKVIISFEEMISKCCNGEAIIVIASEKYWMEMEHQVLNVGGIKRYFVFHEKDILDINSVLP